MFGHILVHIYPAVLCHEDEKAEKRVRHVVEAVRQGRKQVHADNTEDKHDNRKQADDVGHVGK